MRQAPTLPKGIDPAPGDAPASLHRSGAVARMLRMPVATLRVWERRYGLTQPRLSAGGQRLYGPDDVRRLTLIKQLNDLGHAIGSLAALDMRQLQQVAANHAQALAAGHDRAAAPPNDAGPARPWRLAVIGPALGLRLQRPALLRQLGRPVVLLGPFDDAAQAAAALRRADLDALLVHEGTLYDGCLAAVEAASPALAEVPKAVLYRFASDAVCEALAAAGTLLLREPQPDAVLAQWLRSLAASAPASPARAQPAVSASVLPLPPPRWDLAALEAFANRSATIACECPRHVAELLVQLTHFEAYSAGCEHRTPADAPLHAYLHQVAATSRLRFEAALAQVALHEGLLLPPAAPSASTPAPTTAPPPQRGAP